MGTLYKRPDAGGKKGKWYGAYTGHDGKRKKRCTGTTDKQTAGQILANWETEAAKRAGGLIDAAAERYTAMGQKPLAEHLDDFEAKLTTAGKSKEHIGRTRNHIEVIAAFAKFTTLADIQPEGVERYVAEMVNTHNRSARTCQAHIQSVKSFTKWAKRTGRIQTNTLDIIDRPNPDRDRRLERRAITVEEWQRIKAATESGPERMDMAPIARSLLYETAIQTGLRANELRQLTRGRLHLDAAPPFVLAKAGTTKAGEMARQYITHDLAERLEAFTRGEPVGDPVFGMPPHRRMADMAREDLAAAREAWLGESSDEGERKKREGSDFLAPINGDGDRFDFHALRHSCGTWLAIAGVHPKAIQSVMRHSTITLTLDRYGHLLPSMEATAIADMGKMIHGTDPKQIAKAKQEAAALQQ